jgi:lysophospholipase L1-like esterase
VADWRSAPSLPGAVALAGDSLASRFPSGLLDELHPGILRRGWAGETAVALEGRIDEVLERDLATVLLQTGTNDLLRGASTEALLATYARLIDRCRASAHRTALVILALPPVTPARLDPRTVATANVGLRAIAEDAGAAFVDTFTPLAGPDGTPVPDGTTDGVHLSPHGYRVVAALLRPHVDHLPLLRGTHRDPAFPSTLSHPT